MRNLPKSTFLARNGVVWRNLRRLCTNETIKSFQDDEIFFIELNKPEKRNCIDSKMADKLLLTFDKFENSSASVGIIYGKGGNFCAGFDMSEYNDCENSKLRIGLDKLFLKKPLIAALDGYTLAAGLELALMCDYRVCEEDAILGFLNRRFNIPCVDGGTYRLPRIIGFSAALQLIMTGRRTDAKFAKDVGLVDEISAIGCALGNAVSLALCITKFEQESLIIDRLAAYRSVFDEQEFAKEMAKVSKNLDIIKLNGPKAAKMFLEEGIGKHGCPAVHSQDELRLKNIAPEVL